MRLVVMLEHENEADAMRALRWLLKIALRRFGLRCVEIATDDARPGGAS